MDPTEVDWPFLICRLNAAGLTKEQLARELQVSPRSIYRWFNGEYEPLYSAGAKLVSIYQTVYKST